MRKKDLIAIADLRPEEIRDLFAWTARLKRRHAQGIPEQSLRGKVLGMIFEKSSMRTRLSFEVAMIQLGGQAINLGQASVGLGSREAVQDVAKVMSRYVDGIVIRTYDQKIVREMARHSRVPVINGLSDELHPCQALADLYTVQEQFGALEGLRLAFVGDGNNVARSLAMTCAKLGLGFSLASPAGYEFHPRFQERLRRTGRENGFSLQLFRDPQPAVREAQVIYTDVWTSMGQEAEAEARRKTFARYQVNAELLAAAPAGAVVMHCLPAHRGDEITDEVLDGPASIVYDQAENRLHLQKALLRLLLGPPPSAGLELD